ncbi:hypothetical protein EGT41_15420 [Burkholderia cenocepacia]|uniref:Uncharacterized protein n=1 Tax=Burkholderia cenocepacia TaxID=95486 RepID=A0A3R9CVV5_9BURK|nr:hypothetical protein EGT41_15420 [Burkholderia cenocepacia]
MLTILLVDPKSLQPRVSISHCYVMASQLLALDARSAPPSRVVKLRQKSVNAATSRPIQMQYCGHLLDRYAKFRSTCRNHRLIRTALQKFEGRMRCDDRFNYRPTSVAPRQQATPTPFIFASIARLNLSV